MTQDARAPRVPDLLLERYRVGELPEGEAETLDRRLRDDVGLRERLAALELSIPVKADEEGKLYGSVSAHDLEVALAAHGLETDRRKIVLEHHIKELGTHPVHVKLHPDVRGTLQVNVVRE